MSQHAVCSGLAEDVYLFLLNYEIIESTMSYSDLLIEFKDLVDTHFHAQLSSIQTLNRFPYK